MTKQRIVFFGTPEFAVPTLEQLASSDDLEIVAVVTQPDKPANRGQQLTPPPVKSAALKWGLKVLQPPSVKSITISVESSGKKTLVGQEANQEFARTMNEEQPIDAFVVVAYGKILPPSFLTFPRLGSINIHPSLLPRWRGAAPIQHALFAGDRKTGVAIMQIDEGLDSGPVFTVTEVPIEADDDFGTLHDRLSQIAAKLMLNTLPEILSGKRVAQVQSLEGITYAEKWDKDDQIIQWAEEPEVTLRRIRTCCPHLGAKTSLDGESIKIFRAHSVPLLRPINEKPGTIIEINRQELVVTAGSSGYIAIDEIQFPGKKRLPVSEILKGRSISKGAQFQ